MEIGFLGRSSLESEGGKDKQEKEENQEMEWNMLGRFERHRKLSYAFRQCAHLYKL